MNENFTSSSESTNSNPQKAQDEALHLAATQEKRSHRRVIFGRLLVLVVFLGLWQGVSGRFIRVFWLSQPTLVVERLIKWFGSANFWIDVRTTLLETLLGFIFGASAGFAVGLSLGRSKLLADIFRPFIVAFNALPKIALAPLFILWFGIGLQMKVILASVIVFFLVFYNTYTGASNVEKEIIEIVRTMGGTRRHILLKVVIPSALLWVFTGLRISVPYALIGAVIGEIFASNAGIGYLVQASASQFDTTGVFAGLAVLAILASLFNIVLERAERISSRWRSL